MAPPSLSGVDYLQRMLAGDVDHPPMLTLLGISLVEVAAGRVVLEAAVDQRHGNGAGVAHGGYSAALLDSALGLCVNSGAPPGRRFTTVTLNVHLTRPLTRDAGRLRCEGTLVHLGSRIATSEARITDEGGKLYAHGSATCIVVAEQGATMP